MRATSTHLLVLVTTLLAMTIDYLAPWPYVMTPLYAVPVLVAAHRWPPHLVAWTSAVAIALNVVSSLIQHTPFEIWILYTIGLVLICYVAILLAKQKVTTFQLAEKAEEHAHEAERARHQLQQFMGMIAHDLRTPLPTTLGYTQLFRRGFLLQNPQTQQEAFEAIESAVQRMRRLTDDLLDSTRISNGRFEIRPANVDLIAVLTQVLDLHQASLKRPIRLEAPAQLEGIWDRDRLGQLFANLISNAVKYSEQDREIVVAVRQTPAEALISISDHGVGMEAAQLAQLFQPFSRFDTRQMANGLGLGLYIAKGIVETHGGRIWVESKPGVGSTFYVALPLRSAVVRTPPPPPSEQAG